MPAYLRAFLAASALIGLMSTGLTGSTFASIITNTAQPIDKRLTVQPVVLANDNGSNQAAFFGNDPHRTAIESMVDVIWAQAGIDIEWLSPNIWHKTEYQNFDGSQVSTLLADARSENMTAPLGGSKVVNAFFMQSISGYTPISVQAQGTAFVNGNGTFQALGSQTVANPTYYERAARLVAHELGHNLGLLHASDLMQENDPNNSADERLTGSQISTARNSGFLIDYTPPGDLNGDNAINGADLLIWENSYGGSGATGDADSDSDADGADFLMIQKNFQPATLQANTLAVPEPSSWVLATTFLLLINRRARR